MTERLKILSKYSFPEKPSYGSNKCDKRKHYFSINHELNQIGIKIDMYRQEYRFTPAFAFIQAV